MIICHEIHQSVPVKGIICIRKYQIILTLQPSYPRRPRSRMDLVSRCHASPVTYCSLCHECHARSRSPGGRGLRAQCTAAVWQLHQHSLHQPLATSQGRAQSQCHHDMSQVENGHYVANVCQGQCWSLQHWWYCDWAALQNTDCSLPPQLPREVTGAGDISRSHSRRWGTDSHKAPVSALWAGNALVILNLFGIYFAWN